MNRLFLALLLLTAVPTAVGQVRWLPADGPYGGTSVGALVAHGDWYAGTPGGLFVSTDGGRTWQRDDTDGAAAVIDVTAFLSLPDGTLLAGTQFGSIHRLTPGGWIQIDRRGTVSTLVRSTNGVLYAGERSGLGISTDGGQTWRTQVSGGKRQQTYALVAYGDTVLTATPLGIHRSPNRGGTWELASLGLADLNVRALLRTPNGTLFAGLVPVNGTCSLYRSRSEGRLWTCVEPREAPLRIDALTQDSAGRIYAAAYRRILYTDDEGVTWHTAAAAPTVLTAVHASGNTVLVGTTGRGILLSGNRGLSYEASNQGLTSSVADLAITSSGQAYVATAGGVFRGDRQAGTWELLDDPGASVTATRSVLVDTDGSLLAATAAGLRKYSGGAWQELGPPGLPGVRDLAKGADGSVYMGYWGGVWRLRAGQWTSLAIEGDDGASRDVLSLLVDGDRLFAGGAWDSYVWSGGTWSMLVGATVSWFDAGVFAKGPDGSLWAGTRYAGVLRSTDNGALWHGVGSGLMGSEDVRAIAFDPAGRPWIATFGSGAYRYDGSTWIPENLGLAGALRLTSLGFDDEGVAWAGSDGGGLFRYDPRSSTRSEAPESPLPSFSVSAPYPNPSAGAAFVRIDTDRDSVLRVDLYDLLGRRVATHESPPRSAGRALELELPTQGLPTGAYLVRVTAGNRAASTTLVVGR